MEVDVKALELDQQMRADLPKLEQCVANNETNKYVNFVFIGMRIGLASINKKRRELEEYARIRKVDDQIMYSDILHYHYQLDKFVKVNCSNHAAIDAPIIALVHRCRWRPCERRWHQHNIKFCFCQGTQCRGRERSHHHCRRSIRCNVDGRVCRTAPISNAVGYTIRPILVHTIQSIWVRPRWCTTADESNKDFNSDKINPLRNLFRCTKRIRCLSESK